MGPSVTQVALRLRIRAKQLARTLAQEALLAVNAVQTLKEELLPLADSEEAAQFPDGYMHVLDGIKQFAGLAELVVNAATGSETLKHHFTPVGTEVEPNLYLEQLLARLNELAGQ